MIIAVNKNYLIKMSDKELSDLMQEVSQMKRKDRDYTSLED